MEFNLVGIREYDFDDKKTGDHKQGVSLFVTYDDVSLKGKFAGKISVDGGHEQGFKVGCTYDGQFSPQGKFVSCKLVS